LAAIELSIGTRFLRVGPVTDPYRFGFVTTNPEGNSFEAN